jgi:hypothetical protein
MPFKLFVGAQLTMNTTVDIVSPKELRWHLLHLNHALRHADGGLILPLDDRILLR